MNRAPRQRRARHQLGMTENGNRQAFYRFATLSVIIARGLPTLWGRCNNRRTSKMSCAFIAVIEA